MFSGRFTSFNEVRANANLPILTRVEGRASCSNDSQQINAFSPTSMTPSLTTTSCNTRCIRKASVGIVSTEPGMMTRTTSGTILPGSYTKSSFQLPDLLSANGPANCCAISHSVKFSPLTELVLIQSKPTQAALANDLICDFCTSDRTFIANISSQDRSHRESRNQHCTSRK